MDLGNNENEKENLKNRYNEGELEEFADKLANRAMDLYEQTSDADKTIKLLLEKMGNVLGVSKVAIYEVAEGGSTLMLSYDWESDDDFGVQATNFTYAKEMWEKWVAGLPENGVDACEDCDACGMGDEQKELCKRLHVKSYLASVFYRDGEPAGSVLIGDMWRRRRWNQTEIDVVASVSKILNVFLFNMRQMQRMEQESRLANIIDRHQQFYSYILKDRSFDILYLSNKVKEMKPDIKPGDICYEVFMRRDKPCDDCPIITGKNGITEKYNELVNKWFNVSASKVDLGGGRKATLVCNSDISDYKKRMLDADALTGLPLYAMFREKAAELMERGGNNWALLYIDFDKFSDINEKRGMETGNLILRKYSEFLRSQLKTDELICRYFSDVFLMFVKYTDLEQLSEWMQNIYGATNRWNKENFPHLRLNVKTGVYQVVGGEKSIDQIVEYAGVARTSIKAGRMFAIFDESMRKKAENEERIEKMMTAALENGEFVMYLQSKVDLKSGAIVGAEALIRWDSEQGQMMPAEFIGFFEKSGFIKKMDIFMADQVFRTVRRWKDEGKKIVPISVNVADDNINDPVFVDKIKEMVYKYNIPPFTIEIELRESMFSANEDELRATINDLRKLGITFAIDDFGKGISSLNLIRNLTVDVLKLDKDLFDHVHLSEKERSMLTHMVRMAKSLDMKVLCEGIETEEQEETVKNAGCDMGQGYLYGKPIAAETFINRLNSK